ncbi:MAG: DUF58 domain-containing protein [Verrucomicrobia bacterium]|nr:DUF58 domain-containing protein [Verrucomicrobiota bacterium]
MIVPTSRLLFWFSILVLPCITLASTLHASHPVLAACASLLIIAFTLLVFSDASAILLRQSNFKIQIPPLVRLQKDRPGVIPIRITSDSPNSTTLRLGLAFPDEITSESDDIRVALPSHTPCSHFDWTVTPNRRGQYFLQKIYLESSSPFRFWVRRSHQLAPTEIRVYPDLFAERKNVAAVFLKRGTLGTHSRRTIGQGRDFEKLREYLPGDSYDEIHWKASAKRGHPVTKVFQVERTQEVYVVVDASRLSARSVVTENGTTTALERSVVASLILGLAAEQQGDLFGLVTFSDRVHSFVRAKRGQAHYNACRDQLYTLHPQDVTPDFEELTIFLRQNLRKRALIIFLTALDDPVLAENFLKATSLLCRQHLLIVNMLQPPNAHPLFSTPIEEFDQIYAHLGGHLQWNSLRELAKKFQRQGIRFAQLDPSRLPAQIIAQHADVKQRQLL